MLGHLLKHCPILVQLLVGAFVFGDDIEAILRPSRHREVSALLLLLINDVGSLVLIIGRNTDILSWVGAPIDDILRTVNRLYISLNHVVLNVVTATHGATTIKLIMIFGNVSFGVIASGIHPNRSQDDLLRIQGRRKVALIIKNICLYDLHRSIKILLIRVVL